MNEYLARKLLFARYMGFFYGDAFHVPDKLSEAIIGCHYAESTVGVGYFKHFQRKAEREPRVFGR